MKTRPLGRKRRGRRLGRCLDSDAADQFTCIHLDKYYNFWSILAAEKSGESSSSLLYFSRIAKTYTGRSRRSSHSIGSCTVPMKMAVQFERDISIVLLTSCAVGICKRSALLSEHKCA